VIKVTTESGTIYIIDEENKQIKRVPQNESEFASLMKGMINTGKFQPYTAFGQEGLRIGGNLHVIYPGEQQWTFSTPVIAIDYGYEESNNE
jgi:hypothetical protein